MIGKHLFYSVLSLIGVSSIIGAGFCGWLFIPENGIQTPELKIAINVAQEAPHGYFTFTNLSGEKRMPDYLILDEGTFGEFDLFDGLSFYRTTEMDIDIGNGEIKKGNVVIENDDLFVNYNLPDNYDHEYLKPKLGISIELKDYTEGTKTPSAVNNFKKFITLVDDFSFNTEVFEGRNYFFYSEASRKTLNNLNIESISSSNGKNIIYNFNMNYLFKYIDFKHKPTTLEKFSELQQAMKGRSWVIDIKFVTGNAEIAPIQ